MKRDITKIAANNRFLTEAGYVLDRQADYKTGEELQKSFTSMSQKEVENFYKNSPSGTNGNLHSYFKVDVKTKKIKVLKDWTRDNIKSISLSKAISASLVLYRLVCMFPNPHVIADGSEGYKVPWAMYFKHNPTGHVICMSEWKGSFGFRCSFLTPETVPQPYLNDLKKLLNLLLSNNSPHPYDSCVAGSNA